MRPLHALGSAVLFLAGLGASACASSADTSVGAQTASPARELVRLRTRDGDVAVLAGSGGRVVALYDTTGALVRSADVDSLRSTDPALYELLTTSTASAAGYVDATLHESHEPPAPGAALANGRTQ